MVPYRKSKGTFTDPPVSVYKNMSSGGVESSCNLFDLFLSAAKRLYPLNWTTRSEISLKDIYKVSFREVGYSHAPI